MILSAPAVTPTPPLSHAHRRTIGPGNPKLQSVTAGSLLINPFCRHDQKFARPLKPTMILQHKCLVTLKPVLVWHNSKTQTLVGLPSIYIFNQLLMTVVGLFCILRLIHKVRIHPEGQSFLHFHANYISWNVFQFTKVHTEMIISEMDVT